MPKRVLVVEDEKDMAELLKSHLEELGCEVTTAPDGLSALENVREDEWDLVVLDIMLPGVDGLEVCRNIRSGSGYTPILMLTALDSELDRVLGLELGADDYVTKPFSVRELMARVKAIFRRADALGADDEAVKGEIISAGDLVINTTQKKVTLKGETVRLTAKEYELLVHFACRPGRVYTRAQLLDQVWNYSYQGYEHTVNSHINRLRAKIEENPADPRYIQTVWGMGYRFAEAKDLEEG